MAPEQFRGAAQPASDLYALGGTLLYLLSGMSLTYTPFPQISAVKLSPKSASSVSIISQSLYMSQNQVLLYLSAIAALLMCTAYAASEIVLHCWQPGNHK